ncbi:MAG TPA: glycosyl hydrolase family 98, partial [Fibrobacteraceae bacterium]|nr:glycosyl hydrolase family 98 [Fibrobacteraceae bacterium]
MRKFSRKDLPSFVSTAAVLGVAVAIFNGLSNESAKAWDIRLGFWFIFLVGLVALGAFIWNIPELIRNVRKAMPSKLPLFLALGVTLALGTFVSTQIHRQHRVLSDENSWTSMAMEMYFDHLGGVCNQGTWSDGRLHCTDIVNNFKGKSLALLEAAAFLVAPINRDTALFLNFPLYLGSLLLFFMAISRFMNNGWLGLVAMTFLGSMPILMMQAQSASTEVLYIFLLNLLLFFYAYIPPDRVEWKHLIFVIPLLGLFSGTRQETLFCFLPFALYYEDFLRRKTWHLPLFTALVILASWPA